ncbi:MAG: PIN domain-containing protein [Alphaproteobacteria bacterium]|nr:PIN domain-containing protein [Alphaproteobacteria bacterium]
MTALVLDTSVLIAIIEDEIGADAAIGRMLRASALFLSVVNLAELAGVLARAGRSPASAVALCAEMGVESVPFDERFAERVGALARLAVRPPLSLADRCCLVLASALNAPVLTGDRAWRVDPARFGEVGLTPAPVVEAFRP